MPATSSAPAPTFDVMFRDRATGDLRKIVPDVPERRAMAMVAAHSSETLAVNLRRHRTGLASEWV